VERRHQSAHARADNKIVAFDDFHKSLYYIINLACL
jgi:hypothetical protein